MILSKINNLDQNLLKIAVVPCFNANYKIFIRILDYLMGEVDEIVLVDDKCPNHIGDLIDQNFRNERIHILWNNENLGVGGATKKGFNYALERFRDAIIIKIDCDGQMDPADIKDLIEPIMLNQADITKGNRYYDFEEILKIPKIRLVGNLVLSFFSKVSTGYWELFDPNNGFLAISDSALRRLPLEKISNDYFFESDFLFRSALEQLSVQEVRIPPCYNGEISSLKPLQQIPLFLKRHCTNTIKRIFYQYFLFDFNPGSLELLVSITSFGFSIIWSIYLLMSGYKTNSTASSGDTSLFILSSLISMQFFLAFLNYDSSQRIFIRRHTAR